MKPTHGLVPYTGIMPIEVYVDHTGPMTATVSDNALLLEVIAGPDGYDPRQYAPTVHPYAQLLEGGVRGLKIGMVQEGFGRPESEPDVDAKVRRAAALLGELGATVSEVSIPWHLLAGSLFFPIVAEGMTQTMLEGGWLWSQPLGPIRDESEWIFIGAGVSGLTSCQRQPSSLPCLARMFVSSMGAATTAKP